MKCIPHHPRWSPLRAAAVTLAFASAACSDAVPGNVTAPPDVPAANSPDQLVARAIAAGLAEQTHRRSLHAALRDSRWMDHKLLLQEYLRTDAGAELASRAAVAAGMSEDAFLAKVSGLAPMDLYLPFREHRLAWRATENVFVVATGSLDPVSAIAYGPDGRAVILRRADGVPNVALLVLHPAEPRIALAPGAIRQSGDAIELPEDAAKGTQAQLLEAGQCTDTIYCDAPELAIMTCPEPYSMDPGAIGYSCGGGGSPPPPPPPGDYITYLRVTENDGWFGGNMEMEFRSIFGGPGGTIPACAYYVATRNGVHEDWEYDRDQINLLLTPSAHFRCLATRRDIEVWEMDGGSASFNQNDKFGYRYNAANFADPRQIVYNVKMDFYHANGNHTTDLRIEARQ